MTDREPLRRTDLVAYLSRDWDRIEESKGAPWARRGGATPEHALRLGDDLRRHARMLHPDRPDETERRDDLDCHVRVGRALRSVR